jgi:DNA-binding NtrC family response regulator
VHNAFVAVDCTAIPENLIESELYGHVRGAFTSANEARRGKFELADGGTIFLDEIGDMAPPMQSKLLRTLEERQLQRVGGTESTTVDVRVVSATNRDLPAAIERGLFREDLYYRLNTFTVYMPSLRDRAEDILPLARHFLSGFAREQRKNIADFALEAQELLVAHPFPGNVRELRNMVERAAIVCAGDEVRADDLEFRRVGRNEPAPPSETPTPIHPESLNLNEMEKRAILRALEVCAGNQVQASRLLGISRDTLRRRMARYTQ